MCFRYAKRNASDGGTHCNNPDIRQYQVFDVALEPALPAAACGSPRDSVYRYVYTYMHVSSPHASNAKFGRNKLRKFILLQCKLYTYALVTNSSLSVSQLTFLAKL
jgi:hypothetical protein